MKAPPYYTWHSHSHLRVAIRMPPSPATHPIGFSGRLAMTTPAFANDKYGESKRPCFTFIWYPAMKMSHRPLTYGTYFEKCRSP